MPVARVQAANGLTVLAAFFCRRPSVLLQKRELLALDGWATEAVFSLKTLYRER
jgi:hypothetical protein